MEKIKEIMRIIFKKGLHQRAMLFFIPLLGTFTCSIPVYCGSKEPCSDSTFCNGSVSPALLNCFLDMNTILLKSNAHTDPYFKP